jgi:hypothetical protein
LSETAFSELEDLQNVFCCLQVENTWGNLGLEHDLGIKGNTGLNLNYVLCRELFV